MSVAITYIDLLPSTQVEAGEVFCGSLDSPLTAEGLKALKKAVRRRNDWNVVVSSPHACCYVFAQWLANKHKLSVQSSEAFCEMGFGQWEGQLPSSIMLENSTILGRWWTNPANLTPPDGEQFTAFQERVTQGWQSLLKEQRGKTILLVTHPGVIRTLIAKVLGMTSRHFFSLHIEHAAMSRIQIQHDESGEWASLLQHGL